MIIKVNNKETCWTLIDGIEEVLLKKTDTKITGREAIAKMMNDGVICYLSYNSNDFPFDVR